MNGTLKAIHRHPKDENQSVYMSVYIKEESPRLCYEIWRINQSTTASSQAHTVHVYVQRGHCTHGLSYRSYYSYHNNNNIIMASTYIQLHVHNYTHVHTYELYTLALRFSTASLALLFIWSESSLFTVVSNAGRGHS